MSSINNTQLVAVSRPIFRSLPDLGKDALWMHLAYMRDISALGYRYEPLQRCTPLSRLIPAPRLAVP
ncbi:unnamed protein product [Leptosia nina]|uniref:Uncharacterized protein n=1 Tax=Leptosia nina TaxID=320188 RepID=A0AAV1JMK3_9NEOP